jgi:hypothetical protein
VGKRHEGSKAQIIAQVCMILMEFSSMDEMSHNLITHLKKKSRY